MGKEEVRGLTRSHVQARSDKSRETRCVRRMVKKDSGKGVVAAWQVVWLGGYVRS